MNRIQMDFLPIVNAHAIEVKTQKIKKEIECKENKKIFIENLCGSILIITTCYILYIAGCCM